MEVERCSVARRLERRGGMHGRNLRKSDCEVGRSKESWFPGSQGK